jgi:hypothetical protein
MPTRITLALALVLGTACGRPATEAECNEIVTTVARLEYRDARRADAAIDEEQIETIRARVKGAMEKSCIGKRITDQALSCVRQAKTAEEVREVCFD